MPAPARFATTQWSRIVKARERDPASLDDLARRYWAPVCNFIRAQGVPADDAEDLAQETFVEIFRDGFLDRADRAKGRFRSLVMAVTKHVIAHARRAGAAAKRGGGRDRVALDADLGADLRDEQFDRLWARDLVRRGLESMREEDDRAGKPQARALRMQALEGRSYDEIAKALGLKVGDVRNAIHRARVRLKNAVRDLIEEYAGSRDEFEAEVAYLERLMGAARP
jgi:RNA polymerase sigma-70 factor (ECF subfamily)